MRQIKTFTNTARGHNHTARGHNHTARGDKYAARGYNHTARGDNHTVRGHNHTARGDKYAARGHNDAARGDDHTVRGDTILPEVTTTLPEVTTTLPEVTTTLSEVTTTLSEVTTTLPEVTTTLPEVTTTLPEVTPTLPKIFQHHVEWTRFDLLKTTKPQPSTIHEGVNIALRKAAFQTSVARTGTRVPTTSLCPAHTLKNSMIQAVGWTLVDRVRLTVGWRMRTGGCQDGYRRVGLACIRLDTVLKSFWDAQQACKVEGATLAMPKTEGLDLALRRLVRRSGGNSDHRIGLRFTCPRLFFGICWFGPAADPMWDDTAGCHGKKRYICQSPPV
ncbi:hypothetical protein Bbelb_382130 [Branchiostoma belcheri]|nr:hypothetical protein Bbelb_382130 [Branchiostoma belcheri]